MGKKKAYYSLVTDKHQEVVFLGDTETGKVHDKRLLEEDDITFPEYSSSRYWLSRS